MMRRAVLKGLAVLGLSMFAFGAVAQDIDPENVLVIEIAGEGAGVVEILMRPDVAPLHVERIKELARQEKTGRLVDEWIQEIKKRTYVDYRLENFGE